MDESTRTARAEAALPKGLSYIGHPLSAEWRRALAKLTSDGRGRIIYDLTDDTQSLPHIGIVLAGRVLVGWITSVGHDFNSDQAGETTQDHLEAIVAADRDESMKQFFRNWSGTHLKLLCRRHGLLYQVGNDLVEKVTRTWHRSSCEELTIALGMTEVSTFKVGGLLLKIPNSGMRLPMSVEGVLVPSDKDAWECVPLDIAKSRALRELTTPAWWTLEPFHHSRTVAVESGEQLFLASVASGLQTEGTPTPAFIEGLVEINVPKNRLGRAVRAWRHKSPDWGWTVDVLAASPQSPATDHWSTQVVVSGADAVRLVDRYLAGGPLRWNDETPTDPDNDRARFLALVNREQFRNRELGFVCEALGIVQAMQAAPATVH